MEQLRLGFSRSLCGVRRSESLLEGTWLFSWPAAVGIAIPTTTRTTAALGWGPGSGQTVQPHILLADGRNMCVCQAWKPVGKNPEQGLHSGSVFSHLSLLLLFSFGLLSFLLDSRHRTPEWRSHEALSAPANALQTRGLWIQLDCLGSEELERTCVGGHLTCPCGSHGTLGPQLGWGHFTGGAVTPMSLGRGGYHLQGRGSLCFPDSGITTRPQLSVVIHPCDFHH